jgi:hypothetical protein
MNEKAHPHCELRRAFRFALVFSLPLVAKQSGCGLRGEYSHTAFSDGCRLPVMRIDRLD